MLARDAIEAIRERIDIVEVVSQVVTLRKAGSSFMGRCPFHEEKTPSFSVVPHKGIFHCFGCGEGGDVFKFVMKTRGLGFFEAARELGASVGIAVEDRDLTPEEERRIKKRRDLYEICELAAQFFHGVLMTRPAGKVGRDYLDGRGMTEATRARYRLGFAPDSWDALLNHLHREGVGAEQAIAAGLARSREGKDGAYDLFRGRLMIPIHDLQGRIVAFGGRILDETPGRDGRPPPKYVNSPESEIYQKSQVLYGLSHARGAIQRRDRLVVVEGYFDVLSLHQAGFEEAVATCGTALTRDHLHTIQRLTKTVIAQFDADEAGLRAAARSLELFFSADIEPRRLTLEEAKDPDEYIQKFGGEAFEALLLRSQPLFDVVLQRSVTRHGRSPHGMQEVVDELAPTMRHLERGSATRLAVVHRVAQALGLREDIVEERMGTATPAPTTVAPPARWRGNAELNHLFWLLLHFPAETGPALQAVDPGIVDQRPTVLAAIAMLLQGRPLPQLLEELHDPDLARVLMAAAARTGLYTSEQADGAARQILARMELARIKDELARMEQEIRACGIPGDVSRDMTLFRRRQELQGRRKELTSRIGAKKV